MNTYGDNNKMTKKIVTSFNIEVNNINKLNIISEVTGKNKSFLINTLIERYIPQYLQDIEENYIESQAQFIKSRQILTDYISYSSTSSLFGKTTTKRDTEE